MPTSPVTETDRLAALARSSLATILDLQDPSGAYPASPTFSAYRGYSWFRDGAFIADGVSAAGAADSAERFFDWCAGILDSRAAQVEAIVAAAAAGTPVPDEQMLPTRFTFDGGTGDDEWWDFQLDGYGTWLWAVVAHAQRHERDLGRWRTAIELSADYLTSSWSRPCYDWWEEHSEQVHVSTLGCIAAGLDAILAAGVITGDRAERARGAVTEIRARILADGVQGGHLTKWLGSDQVDGSLLALLAPLDVFPASEPLGRSTLDAVETQLSVDGGVHRFLADTFFGGGQWPLLSCYLGLAHVAAGDRAAGLRQLQWAASTADEQLHLPEQVADHLLAPDREAEWIEKWGTVALPLLWSHAMFLRLARALDVIDQITVVEGEVPA